MKRLFLLILLISSFSLMSSFSSYSQKFNYKEAWKRADKYRNESRPESEMKVLDSVYMEALKDKRYVDLFQAIERRSGEKDSLIYRLQKEIKQMQFPLNQVAKSLLALLYNNYDLTQLSTTTDSHSDDIKTWNGDELHSEMIKTIFESLENPEELKKISASDYLLTNLKGSKYRPTLYDFIIGHSLDILIENIHFRYNYKDHFKLDSVFFLPSEDFIKLKFDTNESNNYYAMILYQQWLSFRLKDSDMEALIDADLGRLEYVYTYSVMDNKALLYEKALLNLISKYQDNAIIVDAKYMLANLYAKKNDYEGLNKAYNLCMQIKKEYPKYSLVDDLIKIITKPELKVQAEQIISSGEALRFRIQSKNLNDVIADIYELDLKEYSSVQSNRHLEKHTLENKKLLFSKRVNLPLKGFIFSSCEVLISEKMSPGLYYAKIRSNSNDKIESKLYFQVTDIGYIINNQEIYVMNRNTGEPIPQVKIQIYTSQNWDKPMMNLSRELVTNNKGFAKLMFENYLSASAIVFSKNNEILYNRGTYFSDNKNEISNSLESIIFTDRAIYRPGQTVFYKLILVNKDNNSIKIVPNTDVSLIIRDVNYRELQTINQKTNDFGSLDGSFTIPQGLLNGYISINSPNGSKSIRVEEYKRPSFEVNIDPVKEDIKLGAKVSVQGNAKAYAGYAVDNAIVSYTIKRDREMYHWYSWFPPFVNESRQIASGDIRTNSEGVFTIDFEAKADDLEENNLIYIYTIDVNVTDNSGETQSTSYILRVSRSPLKLIAKIPERFDISGVNTFSLQAYNLNNQEIPCNIKVEVSELTTPKKIYRNRLWNKTDTIMMNQDEFEKLFPKDSYIQNNPSDFPEKRKLNTFSLSTPKDTSIDLSLLKKEPSGFYKIKLIGTTDSGAKTDQIYYVNLINGKPAPIYRVEDWVFVNKEAFNPGEKLEVYVAGVDENTLVKYTLKDKNGRLLQKNDFKIGTTPKKLTYNIEEGDCGGLLLEISSVRNNRFYSLSKPIQVYYPQKKLDIEFVTFRDKLKPGEKEKWQLIIKDKNKIPQLAELAATLYDASLDVFEKNSWDEVDVFYNTYPNFPFNSNQASFGILEYSSDKYYQINATLSRRYNGLGYITIEKYLTDRNNGTTFTSFFGIKNVMRSSSYVSIASKNIAGGDLLIAESNYRADEGGVSSTSDIRTNFNETAFFYPSLKTNDKGEVIVEFSIPESLTRWNMLGFAHTKDLKIGSISKSLITVKDLAITANAPRFFREGDKLMFSAKINNIAEKDLSGSAEFVFFNAITGMPIEIADKKQIEFNVKSGQSTAVSTNLIIPSGIEAITYRVMAKTESHTDGEEKTIPVLSNTILITESMPFTVRANSDKKFTMERLRDNKSTSLKHKSLTLEYTSNPAWYAVQSMPYLMEYTYDCSEQLFSRYYANYLSSYIVESKPEIKRIFDLWKNLPDSKALLSNLEKNQELKEVLLEETPWVMDSKNENEAKKRIAMLFDLNRIANEKQNSINKMLKAQNPNGSFSWFTGMYESEYITKHIVCGIYHLEKLTSKSDAKMSEIASNALNYLDSKFITHYNEDLKSDKDWVNSAIPHYLYLYSFKNHIPDNDAYKYYFDKMIKHWAEFGIQEQAMIGLTMLRADRRDIAEKIIISLKERAKKSEELGMYWTDGRPTYYTYAAPIEQQSLMIELFNEFGDQLTVEELKIWLLKNKQTNNWKTTKATASAIYALLLTGDNLLSTDDNLQIKIADESLSSKANDNIKSEPGTGYVKTNWSGDQINKKMADIEVNNLGKSVAWGALYWQYTEHIDKVTSSGNGLKIEREFYIKKITDKGALLTKITEQNIPKVGDKITIRTILRADRDFEYVHLKDARPSCLEPVNQLSGIEFQNRSVYYKSMKDASVNFFFDKLMTGTYVFEYDLYVSHAGDFTSGVSNVQCMYAPEFNSNSSGQRLITD